MDSILPPSFVKFDRNQATRVYGRNLPHWRQQGATYFVTFRLHDSMPVKETERIPIEEPKWLTARGAELQPTNSNDSADLGPENIGSTTNRAAILQ